MANAPNVRTVHVRKQQLALREQLADMKAMFEEGLIPSREIYEDKVRQILGLE